LTHKSRWRPIFSKRLHFGRSVVVPNHIFNAYNYQINKVLVLSDIFFYHEIINFRCFSNEMKKVKIRVFLLRQKIITLSTTTFVLPIKSLVSFKPIPRAREKEWLSINENNAKYIFDFLKTWQDFLKYFYHHFELLSKPCLSFQHRDLLPVFLLLWFVSSTTRLVHLYIVIVTDTGKIK
jgi:hypothetical protein